MAGVKRPLVELDARGWEKESAYSRHGAGRVFERRRGGIGVTLAKPDGPFRVDQHDSDRQ